MGYERSGGQSQGSVYQLALRSSHKGFISSINATFFERVQPFSRFSYSNASRTSLVAAYQASWSRPYRLVKPSVSLFLCSYTRRSRLLVTPMYSVRLLLVIM